MLFWRAGTYVIFPGKLYDDMMSHLFLLFIFQHNHKGTNLQREIEASLIFTVDLIKIFFITLFLNTYFVIYFCLTSHWLSFDFTDWWNLASSIETAVIFGSLFVFYLCYIVRYLKYCTIDENKWIEVGVHRWILLWSSWVLVWEGKIFSWESF